MGQKGFWDGQEIVSKLKNKKHILTCLSESIPWKAFRPLLDKGYSQERKSNAGRKRIDPLILFKMLVLQQLFNLSDEEVEFQVNERHSFEEFVGLGVMNDIPDSTTVAFFRERLRKANVIDELFEMFESYLRDQGLEARGGQIIDATLIPVPKQRNSWEENKEIKANRLPDGWNESPKRLQQWDLDAHWAKKNDYVWADSAYSGERFTDLLSIAGFENRIHEKGSRNHSLSAAATERNSIRSQIRARVEHVFGCFATSMGGKFTRKIGLKKNKAWWSLKNLTFNFLRYLYLASNSLASI